MLPQERQKQILAHLNETGNVRTIEIAAVLNVTDETIRKDFEVLEKRGHLIRVHGGAVRLEKIREEISLTERQLTNAQSPGLRQKGSSQIKRFPRCLPMSHSAE